MKELLVDLAGHERLRRRREVPHRLLGRAPGEDAHDGAVRSALGELGVWVRLHYVYPYPHVDEVIPLMAEGKRPALPRRAVPAREPAHPEAHEAARQRGEQARAHRGVARGVPGHHDPLHVHRRLSRRDRSASSRSCSRSSRRRSSIASAASPIRRSKARPPTRCPIPCPRRCRKSGARASWPRRQRISARAARAQGRHARCDVLVDEVEGARAIARSRGRCARDRRRRARDGGGKLAAGNVPRVRITGADEHDLDAVAIG